MRGISVRLCGCMYLDNCDNSLGTSTLTKCAWGKRVRGRCTVYICSFFNSCFILRVDVLALLPSIQRSLQLRRVNGLPRSSVDTARLAASTSAEPPSCVWRSSLARRQTEHPVPQLVVAKTAVHRPAVPPSRRHDFPGSSQPHFRKFPLLTAAIAPATAPKPSFNNSSYHERVHPPLLFPID